MLEGARGQPPADVGTLIDCIVRLSWLAHELSDVVAEVDINPLIVTQNGAVAVDALIVRRTASAGRVL